jgi:hypothetical protein
MSPRQLAAKLLEYSGTTSLMIPGPLTAALGSEAVKDALNRGWIRPDTETGFLVLTDQQTQINEMRELASEPLLMKLLQPCPKCGKKGDECKCNETPKQEARDYAIRHSQRFHETLGLGGDASGSGGAPGSGQPQGQPVAPPQQTPTSPTPNRPGQNYMVGEDVMVADEGKSYSAKVQKVNPDGTYVLSFGQNRPTQQNRMFRREEMQRIQPEHEGTVKVQQ